MSVGDIGPRNSSRINLSGGNVKGTLPAAQEPAHTGDVTNNAGSLAMTVAAIQGTTVSGTTGSGNVVFSSGPTMTNPIVGTQTASDNSTKGASTAYVTSAISTAISGVNPAVAVTAATTAASDTSALTYNNGVSGIGATLTGSNNTALTFDGVTLTSLNQRVLVKNDTQSPSGAFNGVYYLTQLQTGILPPILTRALDYDMPSDINSTGAIPVISGTVNASTSWLLTSTVNTIGTDALTYVQFSINPTTILTNVLTNTHLFVGNVSNVATDVAAGGDVSLANTGAFTVNKVNGVSYGSGPSTNTVPVVTGSNTVTYETVPNAALANSTITINNGSGITGGVAISLGGTTTISASITSGAILFSNSKLYVNDLVSYTYAGGV